MDHDENYHFMEINIRAQIEYTLTGIVAKKKEIPYSRGAKA